MKPLPTTLIGLSVALVAVNGRGQSRERPVQPSQMVTLTSIVGSVCGPNTIGRTLDNRQNPDGSTSPFAIPPGMAFVVSGIDWTQGNTGAANRAETLYLHSLTESGVIMPSAMAHGAGSSDSRSGGSQAVSGVAFKSGQTLCMSVNTGNIGSAIALVHGFLVADR